MGTLKHDYEVKAAINGEMALKVAYASVPDIILLDIMMLGVDALPEILKINETRCERL